MGVRSIDIISSSDVQPQVSSTQLTRGTLTSAVVSKTHNAPTIPKFAYAILALHRNTTAIETRIHLLVEGYILSLYGLAWDGLIPIDSDMKLVLTVLGYNTDIYRATCTLIDPEIASSGVPRDP